MRIRLTIAAIVVIASLLAVSAWFKSATCDCGSRGLPWGAIALVATGVAAVSIAMYIVAMTIFTRERREMREVQEEVAGQE